MIQDKSLPPSDINTAKDIDKKSPLIDGILLACILAYWAIGLAIFRFFPYNICPDSVAYFSLAKLYSNNHFLLAINSHWSPLFCWLLAPLLHFNLPPHVATNLLAFPIGSFVIFNTWKLGEPLGLTLKHRRLAVVTAFPSVLYWTFTNCGPDFLFLSLVLAYINLILRKDFGSQIWLGISSGAMGGLCYLAKSYGFPFFIVSFTIASLCNSTATNQNIRKKLLCFFAGFSVFLAVSLPWVLLISNKNHHPTIGTSGAFTFQFNAPNHRDPSALQGLLAPPNEYAVTYWEDPSKLRTTKWSPLNSKSDFIYYLRVLNKNFWVTLERFNEFSPLSIGFIFLAAAIAWGTILKGKSIYKPASILIAILTIYSAGYMLIYVDIRYFWPAAIGAIALSCITLQWLEATSNLNRISATVLSAAFALSFWMHPIMMLGCIVNLGKSHYIASLKNDYLTGQRMASNEWLPSIRLAYYRNAKFYGIPDSDMNDGSIASSLQKNSIKYFLLWGNDKAPTYLADYKRVDDGTVADLRVFCAPF